MENDLLNIRLKELINLFEVTYCDNLKYLVEEDVDIIVRKRCNVVASYSYNYLNARGENKLNLIIVFDGWNEFLQGISNEGVHVGNLDDLNVDVSIYALNINDFNLNDDYLESYSNTNIVFDNIGMFSYSNENNKSI